MLFSKDMDFANFQQHFHPFYMFLFSLSFEIRENISNFLDHVIDCSLKNGDYLRSFEKFNLKKSSELAPKQTLFPFFMLLEHEATERLLRDIENFKETDLLSSLQFGYRPGMHVLEKKQACKYVITKKIASALEKKQTVLVVTFDFSKIFNEIICDEVLLQQVIEKISNKPLKQWLKKYIIIHEWKTKSSVKRLLLLIFINELYKKVANFIAYEHEHILILAGNDCRECEDGFLKSWKNLKQWSSDKNICLDSLESLEYTIFSDTLSENEEPKAIFLNSIALSKTENCKTIKSEFSNKSSQHSAQLPKFVQTKRVKFLGTSFHEKQNLKEFNKQIDTRFLKPERVLEKISKGHLKNDKINELSSSYLKQLDMCLQLVNI